VRKHVMKEFQRERRFQRDLSGKPEAQPRRKRLRARKKKTAGEETQPKSILNQNGMASPEPVVCPENGPGPRDFQRRSTLHTLPVRSHSIPQSSAPRQVHSRSKSVGNSSEIGRSLLPYQRVISEPVEIRPLNPQTILGAGRVDPFESLPVKSDFSTNALVDHYVRALSYMVFRMATRMDFNPIKDTFKLAVQDPVSFHAILTYASSHIACLHGMQNTKQVITHKGETLQLLPKKLDPAIMDNRDGTIMAVQQLCSVEERWGRKDIAKTHWKGLKQLVDSRGGLAEIRRTTLRLETLIDFTDLATDANQPPDLSPNSISILTSLPPPRLDITTTSQGFYATSFLFEASSLPLYQTQFRQFISNVTALTLECISYSRSSIPHPLNVPRRLLMLRPNTALHKLLSAPHQERRGIPFNQIQAYCQMGCLIYLSITFYDYRTDPGMIDYFLKTQELNIVVWDLELLPSIETLLLVFQRGELGTSLDRPERVWWMGRMMGMLKGVRREEWETIKECLFRFVTVNCEG
jgi:hypothetical protein